MFIGHCAVALAAKRVTPRSSLGTLMAAALFLDLLWPTLLLLGIEHARITTDPAAPIPIVFEDYPVSHSLAAVLLWSALFAAGVWLATRDRRAALVSGALVLSHWCLDALVHLPDLPLLPGGVWRMGAGLWHAPAASLTLELGLFALGCALYWRASRARDAIGRWAWVALALFLVTIHLGNVFGPPPPSIAAVAWTGQSQWLIVLWAWWADRHRSPMFLSSSPGETHEAIA